MDFINKILNNQTVKVNIIMLIAVLVCFLISVLTGNKYNSSGKRGCLIVSRIMIIIAAILVVVWLFR